MLRISGYVGRVIAVHNNTVNSIFSVYYRTQSSKYPKARYNSVSKVKVGIRQQAKRGEPNLTCDGHTRQAGTGASGAGEGTPTL